MAPFAEDKFLFKFLGKTLLEYQFDLLLKAGLNDIILVCNPQNKEKVNEIVKYIPDIKTAIVTQEAPKGIADALESASHLFNGELLIINPNDLFELKALTTLIDTRCGSAAESFVLGHVVNEYFPGGYLVIDEKGFLSHIMEKPGKGHEPSNMVNLLVHLHTRPNVLMDYIHHVSSERDDIYEKAVDAMCKDNRKIMVVPYTGEWHAIKYPWNIMDFVRYFLDRTETYISPTAKISERAIIEGKVIIEDNVLIMENAVVKGPVYLGRGTVVGNNTVVRSYSHVGANCIIGFASEIKDSYIEDGCSFCMNYIGDSIIGDHCYFGTGTVTANLRFDQKPVLVRVGSDMIDSGVANLGALIGPDCRFGVNVNIMPGIKIGAGSTIGPESCLNQDVPLNTPPPARQIGADNISKLGAPILQTV